MTEPQKTEKEFIPKKNKNISLFSNYNITSAFRNKINSFDGNRMRQPKRRVNRKYEAYITSDIQYRPEDDPSLNDFLLNSPKSFVSFLPNQNGIKKYRLKNGDFIHCILFNNHFYITGTDIVKLLIWKFNFLSINIYSLKKFEEGIFSDLRNLKPGVDATLEPPRSPFLEFLYKNGCIRTQKKQKVFFWYSVPHNVLFNDALERERKRDEEYRREGIYLNTYRDEISEKIDLKNYNIHEKSFNLMQDLNEKIDLASYIGKEEKKEKEELSDTEFDFMDIFKNTHNEK